MSEHLHSHTHYHFLLQLADRADEAGYKVTAEMFRKMAKDYQEEGDPELAKDEGEGD